MRAQYEALPYPLRDPADEQRRLLATLGDALDHVNYYCFGGRQDFADVRVLVAGGGTGDALVFLAEQLRPTRSRLVYLDASESSLGIARARCETRALQNVTFVRDSLLNLERLKLGRFDYVNCCGVLHHLADPSAGLAALAGALKPHGALCLMVYGRYGRAGIYAVQDALRLLAGPQLPMAERARIAGQVIASLPETHPFKVNGKWNLREISANGMSGLVDMLLHAQDRSYTVPEIYDWLRKAGLELVEFLGFGERGMPLYEPASYLTDAAFLQRTRTLARPEQHALAELLSGCIYSHTFYAMRNPVARPSPIDLDTVPFISRYWFGGEIYQAIAAQIEREPSRRVTISYPKYGMSAAFDPTPHAAALFRHMDGKRTWRELLAAIGGMARAAPDPDTALRTELLPIFTQLNAVGWMLQRHPAAFAMPSSVEMQRRLERPGA